MIISALVLSFPSCFGFRTHARHHASSSSSSAPTPICSWFPGNLLRIIAAKLLISYSVFASQISGAHAFPRNHPDSVRLFESELKHRFDEIFMSTTLSLASTWNSQIEITIFFAGVPVAMATLDYQEKAYVLLCNFARSNYTLKYS